MASFTAAVRSHLGDHAPTFAAFGALVSVYILIKVTLSVWDGLKAFYLPSWLGSGVNLRRMGTWAVVTGSTDGIGKEYARQLARRGFNLVLISRNPDKLSDVAGQIEAESRVQTKCVSIDFTHGPGIYDVIQKELDGLDIGFLFNNVGLAFDVPDDFLVLEGGSKYMRDMIDVNCTAVVMVSRIVLPGMLKRRRGVIVNNASGSATRPYPWMSVYSATKAFVDFFSLALHEEYKDKGVIVQSLLPFVVATKMSKTRPIPFVAPSAESFARTALDTVGVQKRTFGCVPHAVQACITMSMSDRVFNRCTQRLFARHRSKLAKRRALGEADASPVNG